MLICSTPITVFAIKNKPHVAVPGEIRQKVIGNFPTFTSWTRTLVILNHSVKIVLEQEIKELLESLFAHGDV